MVPRQPHLVLAASLLITHLRLATAVCTSTWIDNFGLDSWGGGYTNQYQQEVDFISCPSSLNHSCKITPRDYNITIPIYLNITANLTLYLEGLDGLEAIQANTYAFNQSSDPSDVESIFRLSSHSWSNPADPEDGSLYPALAPLSIAVNPSNVSTLNDTDPRFVDLTVESGWNATLYYNPFITLTMANFSGCDNTSLDVYPMEIVAPYFYTLHPSNVTILAGRFDVERVWLNDSVATSSKKNVGGTVDLERSSMVALAVFGIALIML